MDNHTGDNHTGHHSEHSLTTQTGSDHEHHGTGAGQVHGTPVGQMQSNLHDQHNHAAMHQSVAADQPAPRDEHAEHAGQHAHTAHSMQGDPSAHQNSPEHSMHGGHNAHGEHGAHGGHVGHSEEMFKRPFWVSLVLTIPVLFYSELLQGLLGYTVPTFPGSDYVGLVLGSIIFWYGGWVFLTGAVDELRNRTPGMMTLVALAITSAYAYSVATTLGIVQGMAFYWELATLVTIMLLGHWMEMRAIGSAQSALNELAKLLPDTAERIVADGTDRTERVPVAALAVGDLVLVRPGGQVPADGITVDGQSEVNESMITGESRPVKKGPDSEVIAGTVNGNGALRVRVSRTGDETMLAGIMRLVAEAQTSRTRVQALADRAAYWLTLVAVGVALLALVGWTIARGFNDFTLERVVTTLVVACPHALGLAIPLVVAISTALSARSGILVRDRLALERARKLDVAVFDKTGTLTKGEQGLVGIAAADGVDQQQALSLAAAVEKNSEHIIAQAIVDAARQQGGNIPDAAGFGALPGKGVQATVVGRELQVGGPQLLKDANIELPEKLAEQARLWGERGQTVVFLLEGGKVLAAFSLADVIRPESREAVRTLKEMGVQVAMLTGDSPEVAQWVASELGIDRFFAGVLPQDKSRKIKELQTGGAQVAMVGDGVNDAPALAQADVGIAIGAGTDVARASAGIVLVRNDPRDVARIIKLSRASYRKMMQNLSWAIGYNAIALPLAAGVLAPFGIVLPAAVGALLMSLSTIIVAANAQTLRQLDLQRVGEPAPDLAPATASY